MNLLGRAKTILGIDPHSPLCKLSVVTTVGLLMGFGSLANGATLAPAVVMIQDDDQQEDLDVHRHEFHSDAGGNVEVVILQDEGDTNKELHSHLVELLHGKGDRQALGNKIKAEILAKHGGAHGVFVIQDDAKESSGNEKLHCHLVELLHGKESSKISNQELAKKLRQLADRLEGKNHQPHAKHERIDIHWVGDHDFNIKKGARNEKSNHQMFEFKAESGKHLVISNPADSKKIIIEMKPKSDGIVHVHDGDEPKRIILHTQEHDAGHNVFIEETHVDREQNQKAKELHFGEGSTSDEGFGQSLQQLKNELEQLRKELDQLRSDRLAKKAKLKYKKGQDNDR